MALAGSLSLVFTRINRKSSKEFSNRTNFNVALHDVNRETVQSEALSSETDEIDAEVDAALLRDVEEDRRVNQQAVPSWMLIGIACAVPLFALGLYWFEWGRPGTVLVEQAAAIFEAGVSEQSSIEVENRITQYVELHPDDTRAWSNLMALQWYSGKREAFRRTHRQAESLGHTTPFGDSLYLLDAFQASQLNFTHHDQTVRNRLREVDADAQIGSLIDAFEHTAKGDLLAANRSWENVLGMSDIFGVHSMAVLGQRATRARLEASGHAKITVEIAFNQIYGDKRWLFVYARESQTSPPLAVVKRQLTGERRFEIVLDDSVAMRPDLLLSATPEVLVTARISATADALEQAGDISVSSSSVSPAEQPVVPISFGKSELIVDVALSSTATVSDLEPVFIIVRRRAVSTPIAVRRVYGLPFSETIELTTADLMLPNISISALEELEVKARLSKSHSAIAQPGDIESEAVSFAVGSSVQLKLDKEIPNPQSN